MAVKSPSLMVRDEGLLWTRHRTESCLHSLNFSIPSLTQLRKGYCATVRSLPPPDSYKGESTTVWCCSCLCSQPQCRKVKGLRSKRSGMAASEHKVGYQEMNSKHKDTTTPKICPQPHQRGTCTSHPSAGVKDGYTNHKTGNIVPPTLPFLRVQGSTAKAWSHNISPTKNRHKCGTVYVCVRFTVWSETGYKLTLWYSASLWNGNGPRQSKQRRPKTRLPKEN